MGKSKHDISTADTEWEQNTHALFPVKAIPQLLTSSVWTGQAIFPQYHFLALAMCYNCGLHCKRCFETWTSGCFQTVTKQSSPLLVASSTISASILCAGHRLLQRTQRCQVQFLKQKRCFLSKYLLPVQHVTGKEKERIGKKTLPNKTNKPTKKFHLSLTCLNTSIIIQYLFPKHPLDPKLPVIQLHVATWATSCAAEQSVSSRTQEECKPRSGQRKLPFKSEEFLSCFGFFPDLSLLLWINSSLQVSKTENSAMNNILPTILFANNRFWRGGKVNSWIVTGAWKASLKIHSNSLLNTNGNSPVLLLLHPGDG